MLKGFMVLHSFIVGLFGLAMFLLPVATLSGLGVLTLGTAEGVPARLIGAAMIAFATMSWTAQDTDRAKEGWGVVLGLLLFYLLAFIMLLASQLTGVWNSVGWVMVVFSFVYMIIFAFFLNQKVQSLS